MPSLAYTISVLYLLISQVHSSPATPPSSSLKLVSTTTKPASTPVQPRSTTTAAPKQSSRVAPTSSPGTTKSTPTKALDQVCPTQTVSKTITSTTTSSSIDLEPIWVTFTDCTYTDSPGTTTRTEVTTITDYNLAWDIHTVFEITDTQTSTAFLTQQCGARVPRRGAPTVCLPVTSTKSVTSVSTAYTIVTSVYTAFPIKTECKRLSGSPTATRTMKSTSWYYPTATTTTVGIETTITSTKTVCQGASSTSTADWEKRTHSPSPA